MARANWVVAGLTSAELTERLASEIYLVTLWNIPILKTVDEVKRAFLQEATASPELFADVAKLEQYVSETYATRSFFELLQNADDAGATSFKIIIRGGRLLCANNGQEFTIDNLISLCRSGASTKSRGASIGYRGIGFKSVVGLSSRVHLLSGGIRVSFDKLLSAKLVGTNVEKVPLIRIPHDLAKDALAGFESIADNLEDSGFRTIFLFDRINSKIVENDAAALNPDCMIFLRNILDISIDINGRVIVFKCRRVTTKNGFYVDVAWPERNEAWEVCSHNDVDLAFALINQRRIPIRSELAFVHAYLPTLESTGLGIKINSDFSTDPSRTRIVLDEFTLEKIELAASVVIGLIESAIKAGDSSGSYTLVCLATSLDLATIELQRPSFKTALAKAMRRQSGTRFANVVLRPAWLNALDFLSLANEASLLPAPMVNVDGNEAQIEDTMRMLGANRMRDELIVSAASGAPISESGQAEIVAHAIRALETRQPIAKGYLNIENLWIGEDGARSSVSQALAKHIAPDKAFSDRLASAGITTERLAAIGIKSVAVRQSKSFDIVRDPLQVANMPSKMEASALPSWRNGETMVMLILENHGYMVEDHSRQNLGYDIQAKKDGNIFYVEVKNIQRVGEPFTMTSNEEAVARRFGENYLIALVRNLGGEVELSIIANPTGTLALERQCRQWVWECSSYPYAPSRYRAG